MIDPPGDMTASSSDRSRASGNSASTVDTRWNTCGGLQFGEPRDLHGSGSRRAAQIIAFEVGDHEQLTMVLAGLLKGGAVGRVRLHGEATWPRSFGWGG